MQIRIPVAAMPEPSDAERLHHEALQRELEAAQRRRDSYQALLKDLPQIFEGKFRERLRPLQQRNEQLQLEGLALREQIRRALPAETAGRTEEPPEPPSASAPPVVAPESPAVAPLEAAEISDALLPQEPAVEAAPLPQEPPSSAAGAAVDHEVSLPAPPAHSPLPDPAAERRAGWLQRLRQGQPASSWQLAAGVALGCAMALLPLAPSGLWGGGSDRDQTPRRTATPAVSPIARSSGVAPGSLQLSSRENSWLEVESLDGRVLFYGLLKGQRSFPVGAGIRVRSGRPDLIRVRWPGGGERPLGSLQKNDWQIWQSFSLSR